jgi:NAD(P)-dependent dehydrogenase (short-subunit alcohol dehydrogenase family)
MMSKRLEGKVAIITGAGTGIGEAVAHKFAREGAQVVVNSLPENPIEDVAGAIRGQGGEAVAYVGDVSEEGHAIQCVQTAINMFSKLDILVNNAGVHYGYAEIDQFPVDKFDRITTNNIRERVFDDEIRDASLEADTRQYSERRL